MSNKIGFLEEMGRPAESSFPADQVLERPHKFPSRPHTTSINDLALIVKMRDKLYKFEDLCSQASVGSSQNNGWEQKNAIENFIREAHTELRRRMNGLLRENYEGTLTKLTQFSDAKDQKGLIAASAGLEVTLDGLLDTGRDIFNHYNGSLVSRVTDGRDRIHGTEMALQSIMNVIENSEVLRGRLQVMSTMSILEPDDIIASKKEAAALGRALRFALATFGNSYGAYTTSKQFQIFKDEFEQSESEVLSALQELEQTATAQ